MSNLAQFYGLNLPVGATTTLGFYPSPGITDTGLARGEVTVNGQTWMSLDAYRELSKTNYPALWAVLGDGFGLPESISNVNYSNPVVLLSNSTRTVAMGSSSISYSSNAGSSFTNSTEPAWTFDWGGVANDLFFVAGTIAAELATSTDNGVTFTSRTLTDGPIVKDCAYGNSVYVVVGSGGTNNIAYSSNATSWTTVAEAGVYTSVAFGNGVFVAVGNSGLIKTSTNGSSWTTRTNPFPTNVAFTHAFYINNQFVIWSSSTIGGYTSTTSFATSSDGTTWTVASTSLQTPNPSSAFPKKAMARLPSGALYCPRQYGDWVSFDGMTWRLAGLQAGTNSTVTATYDAGGYLIVKRTTTESFRYPRKTDTVCLWPTSTEANVSVPGTTSIHQKFTTAWIRVK